MKFVLILGLLLSTTIGTFAQENIQRAKTPLVMPPYFGVFTRIEGQSSFRNNRYNTALSTSGIEIFLGKKKLYFYGQISFQYDTGRDNVYLDETVVTTPYAVGSLIGMGGYLFDKRSSIGTGWSMVMNGGFGMRMYIPSPNQSDDLEDYPLLGAFEGFGQAASFFSNYTFEINTSVRYHFSKHFGLQFGSVLGFDMIAVRRRDLAIRYGLSFGLVF